MQNSSRNGISAKLKEFNRKVNELLIVDSSRYLPNFPQWGKKVFQIDRVTGYFDVDVLIGGGAFLMLSSMILYYGLTTMDMLSIIFSLIFIPICILGIVIAFKNLTRPSVYVFDNGVYYPNANQWSWKLKNIKNTFIPFYEMIDLQRKRNRIILITTSGNYSISLGRMESDQLYYYLQNTWDRYRHG